MCQFRHPARHPGVEPGGGLSLLPALIAHQGRGLADGEDPDSDWTGGELPRRLRYGPGLHLRSESRRRGHGESGLQPGGVRRDADRRQHALRAVLSGAATLLPARQQPAGLPGSRPSTRARSTIPTWPPRSRRGAAPGTCSTSRPKTSTAPFILPFEESSRLRLGGESLSNVLRVRRAFDSGSFIGGLLTDRRHGTEFDKHGLRIPVGGGTGTVGGLDWRLRFAGNWSWEFQALASHTEEPVDSVADANLASGPPLRRRSLQAAFDGESYAGHALYSSVERDGRIGPSTWTCADQPRLPRRERLHRQQQSPRDERLDRMAVPTRRSWWRASSPRPSWAARGTTSTSRRTSGSSAWWTSSLIKRTYLELHQLLERRRTSSACSSTAFAAAPSNSPPSRRAVQFGGEFALARTIRRRRRPLPGQAARGRALVHAAFRPRASCEPSVRGPDDASRHGRGRLRGLTCSARA